eukprot:CAMPEP_0172933446 /NCGR_PEP_ID=MMETSP1075-20121228/220511_1 /TAXON_ID=2916 /ORGANISM="Ceratium fusus, Strain PA161109" /LENGTH=148 /DNA_ID=CAMNT_0013794789 /DNA_START=656 /DNA_END=1104 /DNA_ORIENTATION=+
MIIKDVSWSLPTLFTSAPHFSNSLKMSAEQPHRAAFSSGAGALWPEGSSCKALAPFCSRQVAKSMHLSSESLGRPGGKVNGNSCQRQEVALTIWATWANPALLQNITIGEVIGAFALKAADGERPNNDHQRRKPVVAKAVYIGTALQQ